MEIESKMIHIVICEYMPEFFDGRVSRISALEKYLKEREYKVTTYSFGGGCAGDETSEYGVKIKYPGLKLACNNRSQGDLKKLKIFRKLILKLGKTLIPDRYVFGVPLIYKKVNKNIKNGDVVMISVPLFSMLILAIFLDNKKCKIILDYRDLYVNSGIFSGTYLRNTLAKIIENFALKKATCVVVTNEKAGEYFKGKGYKSLLVSNGISKAEFQYIETIKTKAYNDKVFKGTVSVGYFGNLGNKRDCRDLIIELQKTNANLIFYGNIDDLHKNILKDGFKGQVSKYDSLCVANDCDVLLVVIRSEENSSFAIPAKVYQYIALNKPIIAYCPKDALLIEYLNKINHLFYHIDCELTIDCDMNAVFNYFKHAHIDSDVDARKKLVIRENEFDKLSVFLS